MSLLLLEPEYTEPEAKAVAICSRSDGTFVRPDAVFAMTGGGSSGCSLRLLSFFLYRTCSRAIRAISPVNVVSPAV
jgi:hypothetical protein